ncbi:MAG: hypothetical protein JO233_01980, partial [Candidatus Eremiobacteraeota bacterium]|nr:hypothetical protein [Candidatus Eremiobacteraeota bacterium]
TVYGDLAHPGSTSVVHRNLQRNYAQLLSRLANAPAAGTPSDAQALARHELGQVRSDVRVALRSGRLDLLTRAHLEALNADLGRALETRSVVPVTPTGG